MNLDWETESPEYALILDEEIEIPEEWFLSKEFMTALYRKIIKNLDCSPKYIRLHLPNGEFCCFEIDKDIETVTITNSVDFNIIQLPFQEEDSESDEFIDDDDFIFTVSI